MSGPRAECYPDRSAHYARCGALMPNFDEIRRLLTPTANYNSAHSSASEWVVPCSDSPYDFEMIDLMTCALEAAWTTAGTKALILSEDDWAEMAAAISGAGDSGE